MNCPTCKNTLSAVQSGDITVDACCDDGCGGIFFDSGELEQVDESHEAMGEKFLRVQSEAKGDWASGYARPALNCPRCETVTMIQQFFSPKREVVIDQCAKCGGIWLDKGELARIRAEFSSREERETELAKFYREMFGSSPEVSKDRIFGFMSKMMNYKPPKKK